MSRIGVGLIGPGAIGRTLLNQLASQRALLVKKYRVDTRLIGVIGSKRMHLDSHGMDLARWSEVYRSNSVDADLDHFFERVKSNEEYAHCIFVDCTASDEIPDHYNRWLQAGVHLVTPNKKFVSGPLERYKRGKELCTKHGSQFLYEATVGAGLPVISTLQGLLDTGDEVEIVEGVFSGTLSFIFSQVSKEMTFSQAVSLARESGFTEPDPRDDLSGMDVARKVIVLARECGMDISLEDLEIESLVPKELQSIPDAESFMSELPKCDEDMLGKVMEADSSNEVLRYVGVVNIKERKCEVALRRYPKQHALGGLSGTDNMIIFRTARYNEQPLVIQGPGAGAQVTAMGVFSDFMTITKRLVQ